MIRRIDEDRDETIEENPVQSCRSRGAGKAINSVRGGYVPGLEYEAAMGRIEWVCPRCKEQAWGMALKSDPTPTQPAFRVLEKDAHEH